MEEAVAENSSQTFLEQADFTEDFFIFSVGLVNAMICVIGLGGNALVVSESGSSKVTL
jgi:hypothetical protein